MEEPKPESLLPRFTFAKLVNQGKTAPISLAALHCV